MIIAVQPLPDTKSCFACGKENPHGLQLAMQTDGSKVQAEFTPTANHAGFKGVVHGGVISSVLDELMAWACAVAGGKFAYCAELTVRFIRPAHPGQTVMAHAELTANRRRVFETRGEIVHPAHGVLATAQGKYLPISNDELQAFALDFVGDPAPFMKGNKTQR